MCSPHPHLITHGCYRQGHSCGALRGDLVEGQWEGVRSLGLVLEGGVGPQPLARSPCILNTVR